MKLVMELEHPIHGYFDGGPKARFEWEIEKYHRSKDKKGVYVRVGSFAANHWFHVAEGKTDKGTLANAKRRLAAAWKRGEPFVKNKVTFHYEED